MRGPGAEGRRDRRLIAGILLAAGLSSRFGRQKLLEVWQGETLVRRAARSFLDAGLRPLVGVVPADARFAAALDGMPVRLVMNQEPERGISRSIGLGLGALPVETDAVMIGVADQPNLTSAALRRLIDAFDAGRIVTAQFGDHAGNPVIFDRRFFPQLLALEGDRGGQVVVRNHPDALVQVELPTRMGVDIDRPEDWPAEAGPQ